MRSCNKGLLKHWMTTSHMCLPQTRAVGPDSASWTQYWCESMWCPFSFLFSWLNFAWVATIQTCGCQLRNQWLIYPPFVWAICHGGSEAELFSAPPATLGNPVPSVHHSLREHVFLDLQAPSVLLCLSVLVPSLRLQRDEENESASFCYTKRATSR